MSCVHIRYIMLIRNIKIHIDPPQIRERAVIGSGCEPLIFRQNLVAEFFAPILRLQAIQNFRNLELRSEILEFRQTKFA